MTTKCFPLIRGRALRVTRLDGCGNPVLGPDSTIVSDGFITVGWTANTDEGTEINVTNAAGRTCILDTPAPKFTGYTLQVEFCGVDPDLISMMTGQDTVLDGDGNAVGFGMDTQVDADLSGFALEVWSNVPAAACEPGQSVQYGYFLVPFLKGGTLGDFTIGNDAVNFTLSGANSKDGNGWGVGPYDVVLDDTDTESPLLVAIPTTRHLHMQLTGVAPPDTDDACGAVALGVPTTLITAGIPATLAPANSYPPLDLADFNLVHPAKTPTTAWTAGQYARGRDGSKVHWNGTTWVAGAA